MSEMVERVAKALAEERQRQFGTTVGWPETEQVRAQWRSLARAAIAAMREPTDEMVAAGTEYVRCSDELCAEGATDNAWTAMIDAALGREPVDDDVEKPG